MYTCGPQKAIRRMENLTNEEMSKREAGYWERRLRAMDEYLSSGTKSDPYLPRILSGSEAKKTKSIAPPPPPPRRLVGGDGLRFRDSAQRESRIPAAIFYQLNASPSCTIMLILFFRVPLATPEHVRVVGWCFLSVARKGGGGCTHFIRIRNIKPY